MADGYELVPRLSALEDLVLFMADEMERKMLRLSAELAFGDRQLDDRLSKLRKLKDAVRAYEPDAL